jgi:tRNA1Val (adenine37-N6)-methyltransferase
MADSKSITVWQYPKCSTCRKALNWLSAHTVAVDAPDIVKTPPSATTLRALLRRSGLPIARFFNTSGESYRAGNFKERLKTMSEAEALAALAADGKLIKRPLIDAGANVLVGFDEAAYAAAFKTAGRTRPRTDVVRGQNDVSPNGGILRATRRPAGWSTQGPQPQVPTDPALLADLWPRPNEDLCWLAGDWRILQRTDGHRYSLDDLVTAHFAARVVGSAPTRALDLGCGIGTVLLLTAWRFPEARMTGIEAQAVSAELARRSIAWNGVGARCQVVNDDFRTAALPVADGSFDLITGTPPYFPRGTGSESDEVQRAPCRFEHRGGIDDYSTVAAQHLAPDGVFVACTAALHADRVADAAAQAGLRVDRWRDVIPKAGKDPLVVVFSMRHAYAGTTNPIVVEPPLIVRDARGQRTEEFIALRADMGMPP